MVFFGLLFGSACVAFLLALVVGVALRVHDRRCAAVVRHLARVGDVLVVDRGAADRPLGVVVRVDVGAGPVDVALHAVVRGDHALWHVRLTAEITCTDASPGSVFDTIPASRPRDVATATPLRCSLASCQIPSPGSITASGLRCTAHVADRVDVDDEFVVARAAWLPAVRAARGRPCVAQRGPVGQWGGAPGPWAEALLRCAQRSDGPLAVVVTPTDDGVTLFLELARQGLRGVDAAAAVALAGSCAAALQGRALPAGPWRLSSSGSASGGSIALPS
jgi:hypothetical protein